MTITEFNKLVKYHHKMIGGSYFKVRNELAKLHTVKPKQGYFKGFNSNDGLATYGNVSI